MTNSFQKSPPPQKKKIGGDHCVRFGDKAYWKCCAFRSFGYVRRNRLSCNVTPNAQNPKDKLPDLFGADIERFRNNNASYIPLLPRDRSFFMG